MKFDMIKWHPTDSQREEDPLRKRRKRKAQKYSIFVERSDYDVFGRQGTVRVYTLNSVLHDEQYIRILKMIWKTFVDS